MDYGREEEDVSFLLNLRHITHPLFIFGGAMNERDFQKKLIKQLKTMFPGIEIMKQDAGYKSGMPDLVLFYKNHYAMLECKKSADAHHQPKQDYYISKFNDWSYATFVYPENVNYILDELREVFK